MKSTENDNPSKQLLLARKGLEIATLQMNFAKTVVKMAEQYDGLKKEADKETLEQTGEHCQKMRSEVEDKRKVVEQRIIDEEDYYTSAVEASSPIEQPSEHSDSASRQESDSMSATSCNTIAHSS